MRQNGTRSVDVVVLGGGPAGAAIALGLTNRGYSTVIIERTDYRGVRIGETLPPAIQPLLANLGVWERFIAGNHSPSFGIRSAWGQDHLHDNDFIFNPYGTGWHVDRARFDEMLARCAEEAGAGVYRGGVTVSHAQGNARSWRIEISCGNRRQRFETQFLVDATGRSSWFARKQGARRITWDCLLGVISFFTLRSEARAPDSFTLIEAVEDGWWYSAILPDSRLVTAYMTDADIYASAHKKSSNYWLEQLESTTHTRSRVASYVFASDPRIVAANTSRLDRVENENWLAIGDAAMAFDPLSGQGVYKALQSASRAAESIDQYCTGSTSALRDYAVTVGQDFYRYLLTRRSFYSREQRWPHSTFWQRRISDQTAAESAGYFGAVPSSTQALAAQ